MKKLVAALTVLLVTSPVFAQATYVNPTHLEFTPSGSHNTTVVVNGVTVNVVDSYLATYTVTGIPTAITQNCGKPAPLANGKIACPTFPANVPQNALVTATITTIGPGGSTPSGVSSPFSQLAAPLASGTPSATP